MNWDFLSGYYPLLDGEGNEVLCRNGNLIHAFQLDLPERFSMGVEEYTLWATHWERALRSLPPNTIVHLQDVYLQRTYHASKLPKDTVLQRATVKYFNGRAYLIRKSHLFFTEGGKSFLKSSRLNNPFLPLPNKNEFEKETERRETFRQAVQQAVGILNTSNKFSAVPMSLHEIGSYTEQYFNGFEEATKVAAEQTGSIFRIGEREVRTAYVGKLNELPTEISNCEEGQEGIMPYSLPLSFELPFEHIVNTVFYFPDIEQEKALLQKKRELFHATRKFSRQNEVYMEIMDTYLDELAKDGSLRPCRMHLNVNYFSERGKEKSYRDKVSTAFRKMDLQPREAIGRVAQGFYYNSYFGHTTGIPNTIAIPLTLPQALCFYQPESNYKQEETGLYFNDRLFNLPVRKDLWNATKAKNFFVMAPTGGGKSFLVAHLIRQWFENDYKIVIVDLGGSYEKLCRLLEESRPNSTNYIRYQQGEPLGINPFDLDGAIRPSTDKINELTAFLLRLWKRGETVEAVIEVSLRKLLNSYYNGNDSPSLQNFYSYIAFGGEGLLDELGIQPEFFPIEEFLHNTSEFIEGGTYGYLFQKGSILDGVSNKQLIVFELDDAKDDPLLVSILIQSIGQAIRTLVWQDRSQRGIVFFDEFAKMLTFPGVLASVNYYYQAIRKQEAAIGVAMQSPNQLPKNDTSASIIDNTPVLLALPSDRGYKKVVDLFNLDAHALWQLESLQNNFHSAPHYTEFFMQVGKKGNTYRLEVPELLRLAYLTDGEENEKLLKEAEKMGSLLKALESIAGTHLAGASSVGEVPRIRFST